MLMRDSVWKQIREGFSEEEKVELRKHVTGEVICPRGFTLEIGDIPEPLRAKLVNELNEAQRGTK